MKVNLQKKNLTHLNQFVDWGIKTKLYFFVIIHFFAMNLAAQTEEHPIAQELAGKWCFINLNTTADVISNSCITLNADGTFEATLDRSTLPQGTSLPTLQDNDYGTWWAKGNQIFYKSSSNGQGSFVFQKVNHPRLENMPMIVISGVAFAAASPHDPW